MSLLKPILSPMPSIIPLPNSIARFAISRTTHVSVAMTSTVGVAAVVVPAVTPAHEQALAYADGLSQ